MNYVLKDLTTNQNETVHVTRIHPFYYDPKITDPRQVANADKQVFDVDKILSHRGNKNKPSTMEFQVKWMPIGTQEAEITWEPYRSLRATEALHIYLTENKMRTLIPSQYKE